MLPGSYLWPVLGSGPWLLCSWFLIPWSWSWFLIPWSWSWFLALALAPLALVPLVLVPLALPWPYLGPIPSRLDDTLTIIDDTLTMD